MTNDQPYTYYTSLTEETVMYEVGFAGFKLIHLASSHTSTDRYKK